MNLDKLMKKLSGGDESAFEQIYAQTRKTVYYIALSVVKERAGGGRYAERLFKRT